MRNHWETWTVAIIAAGYLVFVTDFHASMEKQIYGCHEETLPLEVEKDCGRILGSRYKSQRAIERGIQYAQQQQAPRMLRVDSRAESSSKESKLVSGEDL